MWTTLSIKAASNINLVPIRSQHVGKPGQKGCKQKLGQPVQLKQHKISIDIEAIVTEK
jgi:hypothetical protein